MYHIFLRVIYKQIISFEQHFSILLKINPMTSRFNSNGLFINNIEL